MRALMIMFGFGFFVGVCWGGGLARWRLRLNLYAMRAQTRPMRLEYVLGLRMSLRHTMIKIKRVITLAGGICFPTPESGAPVVFGCSSAVELEPSLLSIVGPSFWSPSSSPPSTLPAKLNASPPKSSPSATAEKN